ncbi:unnamed protein product [Parascedosporium putredinis]|uniref:assimilatory sulfite reductase (NADPH) n=1 Tax=Parascedosporium putredinis TaxID=1442378 RepID=A0A9P1H675_9PEZI|nr:unnamed protein product [Parascedosporium putredinis]CAI7999972.1 unnamed protein product [Parascedosporium putredinis]
MHFKLQEDAGGVQAIVEEPAFKPISSALPFGQPDRVQALRQDLFLLPETFDLDIAAKDWAAKQEKNIHGYSTSVLPLQTRTGAGAFALGYIFSRDFDLSKRHIPQTLLATSGSLRHLRGALDQLSLLYGVSSPLVAHIAAADYSSNAGLVTEYDSALRIAEDLGLGLVSSFSAYETQHISIFATLLATLVPTLHVYDGVRMTRETLRVVDALSESGIADIYSKIAKEAASLNKRLDISGKVVELLAKFNDELGTAYDLFEYTGHKNAEQVLVVFGSTEAQLATQVVNNLASSGAKIGLVKVRVYRPFVEEEFLKVLPESVKNIVVVGQFAAEPKVAEFKYSAAARLTPAFFTEVIRKYTNITVEEDAIPQVQAQQYTFWDLDNSAVISAPTVLANLFSRESTDNVYLHETYDSLIGQADVAVVGDEKLLKDLAISSSVKQDGNIIIKLPNFKEEDVEKRLSVHLRKNLHDRNVDVYALDTALAPELEGDAIGSRLLLELAFIKIARPDISPDEIGKLILAEVPEDAVAPTLQATVKPYSFVSFQKEEPAEQPALASWQAAAKGLAFKEAYGTKISLRPDLPPRHPPSPSRRTVALPSNYDRNIFHIEFDLGDSGVTYKIGEALGIHAENDKEEVEEFINFYGLNADELVQVPSREDPTVLDTRTVFQALIQNVDILGKVPKRFYEALAEFATDDSEKNKLAALGSQAGAEEFKKRSETDTVTYVDILKEFKSARPSFHDLVRIVAPLQRREYSIASAQAVTPNSVTLMIVVVDWVDPQGRRRLGQATRYLHRLRPGSKVTVSVKPSVMKLPTEDTAPLIMAGLGTGLAPFRAFVQYRAMQKAQGKEIGAILLYLGSRHQREEYLYGEEWEAYLDAGVITLLGAAFSRDQPQKIYIQDRMRETMRDIVKAYITEKGSFYLCGPTWPVPDVTEVLEEAIRAEAKASGRKVDSRTEIERLKEDGRYVLEVY